ncbi:MAG: cell surface protein [Planctomycetaceae bacterium]|nr:cell surface protein [Planctomycetaceae bacterium]|tara:strand:+ start:3834 stop:6287 length:2454 start_codon:yes stop_codon:yes gene_type:complete
MILAFDPRACTRHRISTGILAIAVCCSVAMADNPQIRVYPPRVTLDGTTDRQRILVQKTDTQGRTHDLTSRARLVASVPDRVRIVDGVLQPVNDGTLDIVVTVPGHRLVVPVRVRHARETSPVRFGLDVMPVLTKGGCNSGSCHGASRGQRGFRLSVFGFDPAGDHFRITREFVGRRIDLARPAESLLLTKPSEQVVHGGGQRFDADSEMYRVLLKWLQQGAPRDPENVSRVKRLELFPSEVVLSSRPSENNAAATNSHRLIVRAHYEDGTDRDVTGLTVFTSTNTASAIVSADGIVSGQQRGESFVTAMFGEHNVGLPVIVVPGGPAVKFPDLPVANRVDELIHRKLRKLKVIPSPLCDDSTFLRRVYLDTIGLLPQPAEYERFVSDKRPDKRKRLVDELLGRPEFTELWVMKWAELLQVRNVKGGFFGWLRKRFLANVPMDRMVRELLTAEGGFFRDPPAQYFRQVGKPKILAENVAQVFMGTRIQCAQCHNHPFDRWTMNDYYGFAAFFTQLGSKHNWEDTREKIVFNKGSGEIRHPIDQRVMPPKFLGGAVPKLARRDRRAVLADWLTAADNPWFARNLANIAWAQFFGRGIVEPVDDVRLSNPPSNPELLDFLASQLVADGYDFRKLIRIITLSHAYQRVTRPTASNLDDQRNFSHAAFRRLRAEVLHDCLCQATGVPSRLGGFPLGTRAVQLPVAAMSTDFLDTFGRSNRETVCSCEVDVQPNLSQALHLINGATTWGKIMDSDVLTRLVADDNAPDKVISALYVRCLSRPPTARERNRLLAAVAAADDQAEIYQELFWALVNSKEFLFNH